VRSLAIGDPGDGIYALKTIRESDGTAGYAADEEILDAIKLLAKTEGVFAEPAGAFSMAVPRNLLDWGRFQEMKSSSAA
jgi:threonine synthase